MSSINISTVPNVFCIGCRFPERIMEGGRYHDKLIEELNYAYEDEYEILNSYLDMDMDRYFIIRLNER